MFYEPQTLIIVYKDEMLANQMKKLIETKDDSAEKTVGTTDGSINVVAWTEKVWLANKKAGNINERVLFLGNIKGVDNLIPVIDKKFDEHGIIYGWAGNQSVVHACPEKIKSIENYFKFYQELEKLPVPEKIKELVKPNITPEKLEETTSEAPAEEIPVPAEESDEKKRFLDKTKDFAKKAGSAIGEAFVDISGKVAVFSEENFKNKKLMERQMLFFGAISLYNNDLESFMNS